MTSAPHRRHASAPMLPAMTPTRDRPSLTDGLMFGVGFWLAGVLVITAVVGLVYLVSHQHP